MSGALNLLSFRARVKFLPFASPYGRRNVVTQSGSGAQTASGTASLIFSISNDITAATNGVGSSPSDPAGYVNPSGADFYSGNLTAAVWLYFNRTAVTEDPGPGGGSSSATTSAGGAWVNASAGNQTVTASAQSVSNISGESNTATAAATYQVYAVQSASMPASFPLGTLLGNIRIECLATATRT